VYNHLAIIIPASFKIVTVEPLITGIRHARYRQTFEIDQSYIHLVLGNYRATTTNHEKELFENRMI